MDLGILYPVFAGVAALLILAPGPRRDVWRYLCDLATTVRDDMRSFLGWRRPRPLPAFDEADLLYTLPSEWIRQAEEQFDLVQVRRMGAHMQPGVVQVTAGGVTLRYPDPVTGSTQVNRPSYYADLVSQLRPPNPTVGTKR